MRRCRGHRHVALQPIEAPGVDAALQQFQAADDPGQHVVEVVRDAARQLADRLHLLRLAQLLLRPPQRLRRLLLCRDMPPAGIDHVVLGRRHPGHPRGYA